MFPLFLLAAALAIVLVMLLFLGWRHLDRRVQLAYEDDTIEDVKAMLEQAVEAQQHLTSRIEHLEAIIASEPWTPLQQENPTASLTLPDEPEENAPAERAAGRQRSR